MSRNFKPWRLSGEGNASYDGLPPNRLNAAVARCTASTPIACHGEPGGRIRFADGGSRISPTLAYRARFAGIIMVLTVLITLFATTALRSGRQDEIGPPLV